jgi:hypothetical protein
MDQINSIKSETNQQTNQKSNGPDNRKVAVDVPLLRTARTATNCAHLNGHPVCTWPYCGLVLHTVTRPSEGRTKLNLQYRPPQCTLCTYTLCFYSADSPVDAESVNSGWHWETYRIYSGPGSSVGIATDYGLDGPGIESRWGWNFSHTSRPALGPTLPPVQWVPVFHGGKAAGAWCWPPIPF